jgi:hypothetical protein
MEKRNTFIRHKEISKEKLKYKTKSKLTFVAALFPPMSRMLKQFI